MENMTNQSKILVILMTIITIGASLTLVILFLLGWFDLPLITVQAASSNSLTKSECVSMKVTSTPTIIPNLIPTATTITLPLLTPILPSTSTDNIEYKSYFAHSWDIPEKESMSSDFWIEVDLSEQMLFAYESSKLINSFPVSTGTKAYPTTTGTYKIYAKYLHYNMRGPGYYLPNVPYSMFFYKGYSLHGTYWHHNFGTPMSHGCVNLETGAAAWLYERAQLGTYVFVHS